ncbi:hypothetical protein RI367_005685 [Sorochytrium milnesiophthora]
MVAANGQPDAAAVTDGEADIWASFLHDAHSSRQLPVRQLLVLGNPQAGKSDLITHIARGAAGKSSAVRGSGFEQIDVNGVNIDLGVSYAYTDITGDDDHEDLLMRLGFYHMSSPHHSHQALLPLNADFQASTLAVIVLDWSKPWLFLEQLEGWLAMLETLIKSTVQPAADANQPVDTEWWERLREAVDIHWKTYAEPSAQANGEGGGQSRPVSLQIDALLPLGPGCLTRNLGIPIAIVCAKSDYMTVLEREQDYREERFDFIQQVLRTIALQYGAGLFYTTVQKPATFATLRAYALHRLCSNTTAFAYPHKAQVIERDTIAIPAGWDSRGKIKLLRDGFVCEDFDMHSEGFTSTDINSQSVDPLLLLEDLGKAIVSPDGVAAYASVVVNAQAARMKTLAPITITAEDEQQFLERQAELLSKSGVSTGAANDMINSASAAENAAARLARLARLKQQPDPNGTTASATATAAAAAAAVSAQPRLAAPGQLNLPTTPGIVSAGEGGTGTPTDQNQVLANFFQSLLKKSSSSATTPTSLVPPSLSPSVSASNIGTLTGAGAAPSALAGGSVVSSGGAAAGKKDLTKELERIRMGLSIPGAANSAPPSANPQ